MSKDMRSNLTSIDILNGNFSLKLSLFFFDKFSFTDYKINFRQNDYEWLDIEQKTFILGSQPEEIKLFEAKKDSAEVSSVVGDKKIIRKDVVSTSDSKYKDFDVTNAVQTYDILGKHLYEFPKSEGEIIPDVFTTIFSYFHSNEEFMKAEGVFRLAGSKDKLKEIEKEIYQGNYFYLTEVDDPLTVAVLLK